MIVEQKKGYHFQSESILINFGVTGIYIDWKLLSFRWELRQFICVINLKFSRAGPWSMDSDPETNDQRTFCKEDTFSFNRFLTVLGQTCSDGVKIPSG